MLGNIMNATLHPISTAGILEWMLWRWQINPSHRLILILPQNEGEKAAARLRVTLSRIRKHMKTSGIKDMQHFGFNHHVGEWSEPDGSQHSVLYLNRFVDKSHLFGEVFAKMGDDLTHDQTR